MKNHSMEILLEDWFNTDLDKLDKQDLRSLEGFINSYDSVSLKKLNSIQLQVLYILFIKHSENTDHLSYSIGRSRRATINTGNALVRKGFAFWDLPTTSNTDAGLDLTLDRTKLTTEDYLGS